MCALAAGAPDMALVIGCYSVHSADKSFWLYLCPCCVMLCLVQLKLDALPPTATYHRGASTDEEAEENDMKKPQTVHS